MSEVLVRPVAAVDPQAELVHGEDVAPRPKPIPFPPQLRLQPHMTKDNKVPLAFSGSSDSFEDCSPNCGGLDELGPIPLPRPLPPSELPGPSTLVDPNPSIAPLYESGESNEEILLTDPVVTFVSQSSGLVYDQPDALEYDPEVLRAEHMFFDSPLQHRYNGAVYEALQAVRLECTADYQAMCAPMNVYASVSPMDVNLVMFSALVNVDTNTDTDWRRKLSSSLESGSASESSSGSESASSEDGELKLVASLWPKATLRSFSNAYDYVLSSTGISMASHVRSRRLHERKGDRDGDKKQTDRTRDQKSGADRRRDDDGDRSERDKEDGDEDRHHHRREHKDKNRPCGEKHAHDHFFAGALGYGAAGDNCMYSQISRLSGPCVRAVQQVHLLRESFVQESQDEEHHGHGVFLPILLLILLVVGVVRRVHGKERRRQMHVLLQGLHDDPELKALVEEKLHVSVPEAGCPHHQCDRAGGEQQPPSLCRSFLKVLGVLAMSFLLSISSLCITESILRSSGLIEIDDSTGEVEKEPSFAVVLLLLFLVASVQVLVLKAVFFACKSAWRNSHSPTPNNSSGGARSPSVVMTHAHPTAPPAVVMSSAPAESARPSLRQWLSTAPLRNVWRRPQHENDGYAPLSGHDDRESTEMIAIGNTFYPSPVNAHTGGTMVVSARPVNSVQFV